MIPKPYRTEVKANYIVRCMRDEGVRRQFPDVEERHKVCLMSWQNHVEPLANPEE